MDDDRDLLRAVAARDRRAFAELYRRFAPRVNGFLRQGLSPARAEEVTQEVMLRIWHKASVYDPQRASPSTWIFTVARNARIDAQRRIARPEPEPDDPMWVPSAPDRPDVASEKRADEARVREVLEVLPEQQLEVLERAYIQGQTLNEVAEGLGVPLGTVKSRVRLAMERLRLAFPGGKEEK